MSVTSIKIGLAEFSSEADSRTGEPRAAASILRNERGYGADSLDRELMHRLHGDVRRALEEMHTTQALTLSALSSLQRNLIVSIVVTGIAVIVLLKLF